MLPWTLALAHHLIKPHYQASVGVEDKEGPEDEAEEEVDGVDVGRGVPHVDQHPAEDHSQFRLGL